MHGRIKCWVFEARNQQSCKALPSATASVSEAGTKEWSQTKGVGNRHILCLTARSSRINECLEMESDVNASKVFCSRRVSILWSAAAAATQASEMKYSHFPLICHSIFILRLTTSLHPIYFWFSSTDRKTSLQHEFSNQTSILDLASESALQNGEAHDACGGHAKVGRVSRIRTLRDLRMLGLNWRYIDLNLRQC